MNTRITPRDLLRRVPGTTDHDPARLSHATQLEIVRLAAEDRPLLARFLHAAAKLATRRAAKLPYPITWEAALETYGNLMLAMFLVPSPMLESIIEDLPDETITVMDHFSTSLYWAPLLGRIRKAEEAGVVERHVTFKDVEARRAR